jgi:hypothetical protein
VKATILAITISCERNYCIACRSEIISESGVLCQKCIDKLKVESDI